MGTSLSRDYLLECMELAAIIADKGSDVAAEFLKCGRMKELLGVLRIMQQSAGNLDEREERFTNELEEAERERLVERVMVCKAMSSTRCVLMPLLSTCILDVPPCLLQAGWESRRGRTGQPKWQRGRPCRAGL